MVTIIEMMTPSPPVTIPVQLNPLGCALCSAIMPRATAAPPISTLRTGRKQSARARIPMDRLATANPLRGSTSRTVGGGGGGGKEPKVTALLQRSEEHTSELQSRGHRVCRPLLENEKSGRRWIRTG